MPIGQGTARISATFGSQVDTHAISQGEDIIIPTSEIRSGISTPKVLLFRFPNALG
ncbi:MAG: hypothetical protein KAX05_13150 [Bacteroidales bacterium]|nr:hypothetical protein [Bacteroidales bacterium]